MVIVQNVKRQSQLSTKNLGNLLFVYVLLNYVYSALQVWYKRRRTRILFSPGVAAICFKLEELLCLEAPLVLHASGFEALRLYSLKSLKGKNVESVNILCVDLDDKHSWENRR